MDATTPPADAPLADLVAGALRGADKPLTAARALAQVKKLSPKGRPLPLLGEVEAVLERAVAAQTAHRRGADSAGRLLYGDAPQPSNEETVLGLIDAKLSTGDGPFRLADLARRPAGMTEAAFEATRETVVAGLIDAGRLYKHPHRNARLYGTRPPPAPPPPPPWHETAPHKARVTALLAAFRKAAGGPATDARLLGLLCETFGVRPAEIEAPEAPAAPESVPEPAPGPPGNKLRALLRASYDECRRLPEFANGVVELRYLFVASRRHLPEIEIGEFHAALWGMYVERSVELQALGDPSLAKDRELAIDRDGYLFYFARWLDG